MNESIGFTLPGPGYLFGAFVFGIIGIAAFRYGKKNAHLPTLGIGVALMFFPYVVSETWLVYAVGTALCAALYFFRE